MTYVKANGNQMESMNPLEVSKSAKLGNLIAALLGKERRLQPEASIRFPVAVKAALMNKGFMPAAMILQQTNGVIISDIEIFHIMRSLENDRLEYVTFPKKDENAASSEGSER